ncbi:hypothetical protein DSECCO2_569760 [anaerobic digester metagenome]
MALVKDKVLHEGGHLAEGALIVLDEIEVPEKDLVVILGRLGPSPFHQAGAGPPFAIEVVGLPDESQAEIPGPQEQQVQEVRVLEGGPDPFVEAQPGLSEDVPPEEAAIGEKLDVVGLLEKIHDTRCSEFVGQGVIVRRPATTIVKWQGVAGHDRTVEACALKEAVNGLEVRGRDEIIGVDERDPCALDRLQAAVAGRGRAAVFLVQQGDVAWVFLCPAAYDCCGFVARAVVNDDDLNVLLEIETLLDEARQHRVNPGPSIVRGSDNAEQKLMRRFHVLLIHWALSQLRAFCIQKMLPTGDCPRRFGICRKCSNGWRTSGVMDA